MTTVYLTSGDRVLLLYRVGSRIIEPSWTGSAGGHMEADEMNDPDKGVLRELFEETGLTENDIQNLSLRYVTQRLKKGEIRQNHYYFAELKDANREITSNEGTLKWFTLDEMRTLNMPHSALYMIRHYLETGRFNTSLYAGTSVADGCVFTELTDF